MPRKIKNFSRLVYKIVEQIQQGKVATYGQVARLAGHPKAARAVGAYMRTNPYAPRVPCHRVVGSDGSLVGFSGRGGIATKRAMLEKEGIHFINHKVDLAKHAWIAP